MSERPVAVMRRRLPKDNAVLRPISCNQFPRGADQGDNLTAPCNRLSRIEAVLERISIPPWRTR
jgi:hypothetical protein